MTSSASGYRSQYLTFCLNDEVYAIDVQGAREVVDYTAITPIPDTPPWVRGVLNLRGSVIPVLDIKRRFGMDAGEVTKNSCIIILELGSGDDVQTFGVLADAVREVFELDPEAIEPRSTMGSVVSSEAVSGIGRRGEEVFFILSVGDVFTARDLSAKSAA